MSLVVNVFNRVALALQVLAGALVAFARLLVIAIKALFAGGGPLKERLAAALLSPAAQIDVFAVLRAVKPNLVLSRKIITAYDNNGTAVVTRDADVREVLERDADFAVVYEPRMVQITAGENFFLGMADTPRYTQDVSNMRIAARRDDVEAIVRPLAARRAADFVAAAGGRLDVPQDLSLRVPAAMLADYFGTPGPSEREVIDWTTLMFWYLFADLNADPALGAKALAAAAACRTYLDETIQARKASGEERDDLLGRCLVMQRAGLPGMDDLGIRNNLIGLMIGAVPTISKAATQALDQLLDRPEALAGAQAAALAGNDEALAAYVFEALRFNPVNPLIYRRALRDTEIARGTLRRVTIPKDTMVLAMNLSAMFDPARLPTPNAFRTDRPFEDYMLWGFALHTCFGAHINRAVIPTLLKPLLAKPGLRRADGAKGRIDTAGTPFPVHMEVVFGG